MMILLNLAKRLLPFFLTFMLGLFIASFFVTVTTPKIRSKRSFERTNYEYNKSCWSQKKSQQRVERNRDFDYLTADDLHSRDREINFDAVAPVAPDAPTVPRRR